MSKEKRICSLENTVGEYNNMLRVMSGKGAFGVILVKAFRNNAAKKLRKLCRTGIRA